MNLKEILIVLLNKKYKTIYADPPWYFRSYSEKGEGRNAIKHYKCMSLSDICNLPISTISDDNCVLLMWVVDPFLEQAFRVIDSWGFTYKTVGFTWAKTNQKSLGFSTGLGYWTRSNPEMCLLSTKGNPKRVSKSVKQLVVSSRREHSRKPDEMHTYIEQLLEGPYISTKEGWDSWGNEITKFNEK